MNTRELFEKVKSHLLEQNAKSILDNGVCQYYGPNNMRCAVGALILPECYSVSVENNPLQSPKVRSPVEISIGRRITIRELEMLEAMQSIHDNFRPEDWPAELDRIQILYFPEIENAN